MITFVPFRRKFDGHVVAIAAAFIEKDLPVHIGRAFQVSIHAEPWPMPSWFASWSRVVLQERDDKY